MGRRRKNQIDETTGKVSEETEVSAPVETSETPTLDTSLDDVGNVPSFNTTPVVDLNPRAVPTLIQHTPTPGENIAPIVETPKPKKVKSPQVKAAEKEAELLRRRRWLGQW